MVARDGTAIDSIVLHRRLVGLSLLRRHVLKEREYALSTGYSQGEIVRHAEIQRFCENLAVHIGVRGPANIQLRLVGNAIVVLEVHPRFSGTTSIRADVGFNEVDVALRNFLGNESFERFDYRTGVVAIRALQHAIVPTEDMDAVAEA